MNSLRILMVIPYLPSESNVVTLLAKRVLHEMKKKCDTKIIWILQTPKQIIENKFDSIEIKPIQDYDNACDLIDKEKPDIIFTDLSFDYSSYPFILAGRFKKIPVVCYLAYGYNYISDTLSRFQIVYSKLSRFFSKSPGNYSENPIFGRGRFYLYKYFFFLKTLRAIQISKTSLLYNILESIWVNSFGVMSRKLDYRLTVEAICVATDSWIDVLTKEGIPRHVFHVTGSPIFDQYDINSISKRKHPKFPLKVLLITNPMNTHGVWSTQRQQELVKQILVELEKNKKRVDFAVKIHPTSESMDFYQRITKEVDPQIKILQKEKLEDLLKQYDVAISFGLISGSTIDILYAGLPFIMVNLFDKSDSYYVIKRGLVSECRDISKLMDSIQNSIDANPPEHELKRFFTDLSDPLDGKASERIADVIISTQSQNLSV